MLNIGATVVLPGPDGTPTPTQIEIPTNGFSLELDGNLYEPALTREVEVENDMENDVIMDQCGRTETWDEGEKGWKVRVDCVLTPVAQYDTTDARNLSLNEAHRLTRRDNIAVYGDVIPNYLEDRPMKIDNIDIKQSNDLVALHIDGREDPAFGAQLQFKEA